MLYNSFDTVLLHASHGGPFARHEPYLEPPLYQHPAKHGILLMQPTRKLSLRPLLYSEPRSYVFDFFSVISSQQLTVHANDCMHSLQTEGGTLSSNAAAAATVTPSRIGPPIDRQRGRTGGTRPVCHLRRFATSCSMSTIIGNRIMQVLSQHAPSPRILPSL